MPYCNNKLSWISCYLNNVPPSFKQALVDCSHYGITITREDYQKACKMVHKRPVKNSHPIFKKIVEETVTASDFNKFINEATPESVRDRIRRRTTKNVSDSHQDDAGHQRLNLPEYPKRVQPKRKPSNRTQMHGRGKQGHRKSARTQKRTMPSKFREAYEFISNNIGKPIEECDISKVEDIDALKRFTGKLMLVPNVNRDWLYQLHTLAENINERT